MNIFGFTDRLTDKIAADEKTAGIIKFIRAFIVFAGLLFISIKSVDYVNSGTNYDQAMAFRPICISMAIVFIALMDPKTWINIITPVWAIIGFLLSRVAYINHWIYDINDYKYPEIIRMGKIVIILWGIVIISVLTDWIRKKQAGKRNRKIAWIVAIPWILFNILSVVFMREYYYVLYICIVFNLAGYIFLYKEKREFFVDKFELAGVASFLYIAYMSLVHRPFDKQRYLSYFTNENTAGFYFAVISVVIYMRLYRWYKKDVTEEKDKKTRTCAIIGYLILFGIEMGFTLLNYARTTIIGLLFSFAVMFVIHMITEDKKETAGRAGAALLFVILLFYPTFLMIRYIPAYICKPVFLAWEYDPEERIIPGDPVDSDKYTSITRYLRIVFGKWGLMINFEDAIYDEDEVVSDQKVEIDKDRDVTNGRMEIWSAYISKLNMTGHFPNYIYLDPNDESTFIFHGHNTYLNVMYQYGVPTGIIYGLLNGFAYLYGAYMLLKKRSKDHGMVFAVMMLGTVMMAQLTETMVHPAYLITMSIYFSIMIIMTADCKKKTENESEAEKSTTV